MAITIDVCGYDKTQVAGGPVVWLRRFPVAMRELGFEVRIHLFSWHDPRDGVVFQSLQMQGFHVTGTKFSDTEANVRRLLVQMSASPPDVFIANLVVPAYYAGRYLREHGIPTIGILRSDHAFYYALVDQFVSGLRQYRVSAVVCVSEFLKEQVTARAIDGVEIRAIPSGALIPECSRQRDDQVLRVAYVGRLAEDAKRISDTVRALIRASNEINGIEVSLYGDGPERDSVEQILASEQTRNVRLEGHLAESDLHARLIRSDVIVLLSDYEGMPMAIMEAMACGCVPVCLRIRSGIPELVEDGVTGLLVEDRGDSFVAALRRLNAEAGMLERLSVAARLRAEEQFSIDSCAERWADLINTLEVSKPSSFLMTPRKLDLPSVHPDLAHHDIRSPLVRHKVAEQLALMHGKMRITAGRFRRKILGTSDPT